MSSLLAGGVLEKGGKEAMRIETLNEAFQREGNKALKSVRIMLLNGCFSTLTLQIRDAEFQYSRVYAEQELLPCQPLVYVDLQEDEVLWICGKRGWKVLNTSSGGKKWLLRQNKDGIPTLLRDYS